mmetsp:Transcript_4308/g.9336  ORF Transcript_4308/g.9336 Transcript_4308/m.9336 type:complete len:114 (+) Transcript_4308:162-503(+)
MGDTSIIAGSKKRRINSGIISAVVLICAISGLFYYLLHNLKITDVAHHPFLVVFLPVFGMGWIASVTPLFMYMTYQDDFRSLNPLVPSHYALILKRCFNAMKDNNFKVSEKSF